ncbi:cell division protein ZapA [candidate division KSB1 bacterium]|nr:cell division protein ZapA [candidate division KSB1 bacterium]
MSSDKNVLKVRIYGAEYHIRGDADAKYIETIAEYVDEKMREVNQNLRVDSSLKVAILAAVNIAHELFEERVGKDKKNKEIEDKIKKLNLTIDQKLSDQE